MVVAVKFIGALRHSSGVDQLEWNLTKESSIEDLIREISRDRPELKRNLIDESFKPTKNALILVNGREISVLKGLETKLKDQDEVVFVPVVHGG